MTERHHRLAVAICGAGHSGSTLLGLVLGSHSRCFYAGEAKKSLFIGDPQKPLRKRVCKICGERCPVWGRFSVPPVPDVYEELARITERPVIVDSTKDVSWIRQRADEVSAAGASHAIVFLTRDGRAVVNSRLRKYPADPSAVIDGWIEQVRASEELERERGALRVRYEELATEPEATLRRVTAHLGLSLPFEPDMLLYEQKAHHPLGGNTGTQSVVARAAEADAPLSAIPDRSRGYYESLRGGFRLDVRWRTELSDAARRLFEERADAVNEPFRWERDER